MPKYTTGEMARLCNITVRTVQYYDTRGILKPTELSAGGRRLYSEEDLKRMKIICFLRDLGMPIDSISQLLCEEHPETVISILIDQQEQVLKSQIAQNQMQLEKLRELKTEMHNFSSFSVDTIGDIALLARSREQLDKIHRIMFATGIVFEVLEWGSILLWMITGIWELFVLCLPAAVIYALCLVRYYHHEVAYICPECHGVFQPDMKEMFWARHTPNTRELTCKACGYHGSCVEVPYKSVKESVYE